LLSLRSTACSSLGGRSTFASHKRWARGVTSPGCRSVQQSGVESQIACVGRPLQSQLMCVGNRS
jgi:hypothetical protein